MAKQLVAKCRQSATLIVLAQDKKLLTTPGVKFNYKALLFSRPENSTFFAKSSVFPGGVYEDADESPLWLKHFESIGVSANTLKKLHVERPDQGDSAIFRKQNADSLEKDLSLRITAIRETFEEVGLLLCRRGSSLNDHDGYGSCAVDFDRSFWQKEVHNDPSKFLTLCKEIKLVPDLWSLNEWSAWKTPSTFKKRFETAFFLVALKDMPELLLEKNETMDFMWKTPEEYLNSYRNKEVFLPPPQLYELSRLSNLTEIEDVRDFAERRQCQGSTIILPVIYKCLDGAVSVFPGDDAYPSDPNASNAPIPIEKTIEEFRQSVKNLNRGESVNSNKGKLRVNMPLPDGHMSPLNFIYDR